MTLYDNYKRKLELINKIQDLHLRKKCLKHFLLEFSNSNNNFDADKVIRTGLTPFKSDNLVNSMQTYKKSYKFAMQGTTDGDFLNRML